MSLLRRELVQTNLGRNVNSEINGSHRINDSVMYSSQADSPNPNCFAFFNQFRHLALFKSWLYISVALSSISSPFSWDVSVKVTSVSFWLPASPTMPSRNFNLNDPELSANPHSCTQHDCDAKNDVRFPFWMHKLPSHLKTSLLSHTLSNLESSVNNKSGVIDSLSDAIIPGMTTRLLEQVASNDSPLTLRRDAFLSLKIIVSLYV